jgi:hypothetical protein
VRQLTGLLVAIAMTLIAQRASAQTREPAAPPSTSASPGSLQPAAPTSYRRRNGFIVAGLVLDGLGLGALVTGIELVVAGSERECISLYCGRDTSIGDAGVGTLVFAGAALAVGTPLLVIGLQKVPVESSPRPSVVVGPRSARVHWSF